jgi:hypothetical protein
MKQNTPEAKIHLNHNVYILGAGFSRDAGLPLMSDFLTRMRDSTDWLSQQPGRERELRAVEEVFKFRLAAAGTAYRVKVDVENIEELFSLASATGQDPLARDVSTAIAATLDYARHDAEEEWLSVKADREGFEPPPHWREIEHDWGDGKPRHECPLYEAYAGLLSGSLCRADETMRNTVITFNYDTVLEDSLASLGVPFHYGFDAASVKYDKTAMCSRGMPPVDAMPVLKLHGSVNWVEPGAAGKKVTVYGGYEDTAAQGRRVLLVPPTWRKVYGDSLAGVWDAAVTALSEATRIAVVGFSMPPTDMHFKYLLAAGLRDNVSLRKFLFINPSKDQEQMRGNLFNIMRPELEALDIVGYYPAETMGLVVDREESYMPKYPRLLNRELQVWDSRWA